MDKHSQIVALSAVDEGRFHIRVARAMPDNLRDLSKMLEFCRANEVILLIARCLASRLEVVQSMEKVGFFLTDTLVYYNIDLSRISVPVDDGKISVRAIRPGESSQVCSVARSAFRGYSGHYHADPRLDSRQCDDVYISWAMNACQSKDVADEILVATYDNKTISGFIALRINNDQEGEVILNAVAPEAQGCGIYRSMMIQAMQWFQEKKLSLMVISTQVVNIAAQKVWTRLGLELSHSYYTLHKWFE